MHTERRMCCSLPRVRAECRLRTAHPFRRLCVTSLRGRAQVSLTRTQRMYGFGITCQFQISIRSRLAIELWPTAPASHFSHFFSFFFFFSLVDTVALGWVISLLSLISLPQIATHPEKFALMYTFGNILSLCSTAFLWGSVFIDVCSRARPPAHCCAGLDPSSSSD